MTSDSENASASGSPPADVPAADASASKKSNSPTQKKRSDSTTDANAAGKITKRRAARACVSCRARKVRCDVVEGAPCGNCRWDNVECIVQESRRRKKNIFAPASSASVGHVAGAEALRAKGISPNPISITSADVRRPSNVSAISMSGIENGAGGGLMEPLDGHVPHLLYQRSGYRPDAAALLSKLGDSNNRLLWSNPVLNQKSLFGDIRTAQFLDTLEQPDALAQLPAFIKPLPAKIASEDVKYLHTKGALTLPSMPLQNALLRAYVEYVHPYMPLLELHDFLNMINAPDGRMGQVSLFLYQAVMFSATAFVKSKYLSEAGFASRKAARKAFFTKARLLYDFDYESDRLVLVQALLLMTYWYETPDDQKDTWHWMGVAISLAHTIGLHRNPANANMIPRKQKLWKRIWWSCFMRDRLIALGMRRPTRIKDEDFDVPMLEESDFEIDVLADDNNLLPPECTFIRDMAMQEELAQLCVQKAKLCVLISHMLKAQYSVLIRDRTRPENTTNSTMMLFPNKTLDNIDSVNSVDIELSAWLAALPPTCQYRPLTPMDIEHGRSTLAVQRNLLHMVYHTTLSALHRPQFLPSHPLQAPTVSQQVQEMSRMRVRDAATQITRMAAELHRLHLERYLPTTGVTVILPAMIIHLLEMKNPVPETREKAEKGFEQCMRVMVKLREIYAAADFATGFLDAALRKAAIEMNAATASAAMAAAAARPTIVNGVALIHPEMSTPPPENAPYLNSTETDAFHQNRSYMSRVVDAQLTPGVGGHSPPPTDQDMDSQIDMTPSASGSSDAAPIDMDMDLIGHNEIDWNAVTGGNFDFDQWLQFPAEGVNNSDDTFMGMFGGAGGNAKTAMNWAAQASQMEIDKPDTTNGMSITAPA